MPQLTVPLPEQCAWLLTSGSSHVHSQRVDTLTSSLSLMPRGPIKNDVSSIHASAITVTLNIIWKEKAMREINLK